MFSVCPHLGEGGGVTPTSLGRVGGGGGTQARSRQGGTPSSLGWGGGGVVTPARSRWGGTLGTPPPLGQQKEYSLRGGRYASCVHAEGLSCHFCVHSV